MTAATTYFGRDTSCTTSLRTGRFATAARLVGEAAWRRLNTRRGTLRGGEAEANYGRDLSEYIGSTSETDAAALPSVIKAELLKDERIESVTATVTTTRNSDATLEFNIAIEATTADGPFELQININALTVDLVGLKAEG